jgi:hypothetical protein
MISPEEQEYVRRKAYVPEHVIPLMVGVSGGEPFLTEDYLFFHKNDWVIFIGYPLENAFREESFLAALERTRTHFRPSCTSFIAPALPSALPQNEGDRETDEYYRLDLKNFGVGKELKRGLAKSSRALTVERARAMSPQHLTLTREFLKREKVSPRVRELYLRMPQYLAYSPTSLILNALDEKKRLSAFYVVELGALQFATYVVGCFSRENYVPHASDFLFKEMVRLAEEHHKDYVHLGLGVNEGIRRFKRKWGGVPFLRYEFAEWSSPSKGLLSWLDAFQGRI